MAIGSEAMFDMLEGAAAGSGVEPDAMKFGEATRGSESLGGGDPVGKWDGINLPKADPVAGQGGAGASGGSNGAASQGGADPREAYLAQRESALLAREREIAAAMNKMAGSFGAPAAQPVTPEAPKGPEYKSLEASMTPQEWAELDAATRLRIRELDATHRANFESVANAVKPVDMSATEKRIAELEQKIEQAGEARLMESWQREAAQAEQIFGPMLTPQIKEQIGTYAYRNKVDIGTAIRMVAPGIWTQKVQEAAFAAGRAAAIKEARAAAIWGGGAGVAPTNMEYEPGETFDVSLAKTRARAMQGGQGGPGL